MNKLNRWRLSTAAAVVALIALLAQAAMAGASDPRGPSFANFAGGPIKGIRVVTNTPGSFTSSTSYVSLPGASITFTIPAGQRGTILARFSAMPNCIGNESNACMVRIMINSGSGDTQMFPQDDFFTFASVNVDGCCPLEANSMERVANVGSGTITVHVQYRVAFAAQTFFLFDWILAVERAA